MGMSIDIKLVFGIDLGGIEDDYEEFEKFENTLREAVGEENYDGVGDAVESLILKELGVVHPTEDYSEETKELYCAYWDAKHNALENVGVGIEHYGTSEYPAYILYSKKVSVGEIWDCTKLDPEDLEVSQEEIDRLRNFCEKYGISYTEPAWLVSGYYSN
jgi:hypothetical protein